MARTPFDRASLPGITLHQGFVGTNSSRMSTSKISAMRFNSFKCGCDLFVHMAVTAVLLFPSCSASHTCVFPWMTRTSLILLIRSGFSVSITLKYNVHRQKFNFNLNLF